MIKVLKQFASMALVFGVILIAGCTPDNHVKSLSQQNAVIFEDNEIRWQGSVKGLSYANVLANDASGHRVELLLAKVDPRLFEFRVFENEDQAKAKSLQQIHKETGSVLTFNGAFFDTQFKPMGLLQDSQKRYFSVKKSDLMNGIFRVQCQPVPEYLEVPQLMTVDIYRDIPVTKSCDFWIQNGPILIDNIGGIRIASDTKKLAARTAIGIDKEGNVILVILHLSLLNPGNSMSLYQFAHLLKESPLFAPLGLHSVLNLDGGPSTGVIVDKEYLPEINSVQNAVFVLPKATQ